MRTFTFLGTGTSTGVPSLGCDCAVCRSDDPRNRRNRCAALVRTPGGNLLMKVLEGEEFPALLKETKALFKEAGATKPAASREVSREIFIYGLCFVLPLGTVA